MMKICVITGTRAEYGLLKPLMERLNRDKDIILQLIVTGMHLSPEFGYTYQEIQQDGFEINEYVEIILSSDTAVGTSKAMGLGLISLSEAYVRLKPDMLVILGDRFEMLSAAIAALNCHVPIAHIHGGETTEGALDEAYRHAITKMSYLHFTSTEVYRRRVIQLGEGPDRVFNVGAIAMDAIVNMKYLSEEELKKTLGVDFKRATVLFTFHPATLEEGETELQMENILNALDAFPELQIIFTKANSDMQGRHINYLIDQYVVENQHRAVIFSSLGQRNYLSCMKYCSAVIGNSSSGIIEAPALHIPTVDIGDRQKGRVKAESVIHCLPEKKSVIGAIRKALSKEFLAAAGKASNPYGSSGVSEKIHFTMKQYIAENKIDRKKKFYDIKFLESEE